MTCNYPKLDLVNMNAYIKFGEIMSICSQDIERKPNNDRRNDRLTDGMTDNPNPIQPLLFQSGAKKKNLKP